MFVIRLLKTNVNVRRCLFSLIENRRFTKTIGVKTEYGNRTERIIRDEKYVTE